MMYVASDELSTALWTLAIGTKAMTHKMKNVITYASKKPRTAPMMPFNWRKIGKSVKKSSIDRMRCKTSFVMTNKTTNQKTL